MGLSVRLLLEWECGRGHVDNGIRLLVVMSTRKHVGNSSRPLAGVGRRGGAG